MMGDMGQASELARAVSEKTQDVMLEQLNEFVSRGLIKVEYGEMQLVKSPLDYKVEIRQRVVLKLKDQEYIERLEKENKVLRETVDSITKAIEGVLGGKI